MIPETKKMNVTSNLSGEKVKMGIDDAAMAHIMSVLTDLYSDEEMAVLREYSTNAYDAHVAAGCPLPIEVTLPTTLSPYLKIRDYGDGLDADGIRDIYSRYGTSTKRDSNDLVGTLGLGCKSALTYTDQFTLQGIKDGKAIQVAISRDEDGAGSMTIVSEYATDEPSGVEVVIPVKGGHRFADKAAYLFQFWGEGTVVVNGEEPKKFEGIELDTNLYAARDLDQSVIVMGNVPYPFSHPYSFNVVAYVEIGAVNFVPSREALQMNSKTTKAIEEIRERISVGKQTAAQRMLDEAASKPEALKASFLASDIFRHLDKLVFQGEELPLAFDARVVAKQKAEAAGEEYKGGYVKGYTVARLTSPGRYYSRYSRRTETGSNYPISLVRKAIFFTDFTADNLTSHFARKLEQWWIENRQRFIDAGYQVESAFICDELPHADWIDPMQVVSWEEIKAQKLPKPEGRLDGRPSGAYRAYIGGAYQTVQADDIDPDAPIYFHDDRYMQMSYVRLINERHPDAVIVELTSNRVAKFQRLFPNAKSLNDGAQEIAAKWFKKLSKQDRLALSYRENHTGRTYQKLSDLDPAKVEDPEVVAAIEMDSYKLPAKVAEAYKKFEGLIENEISDWVHPGEKYPLLNLYLENYFGGETEIKDGALNHLYIYLNAAYAAGSEQ